MKALTVEAVRALTKIANLQIANISQTKIAEIMQVSEAAISQIVASTNYKNIHSEKLAERYEQTRELDCNWDTVELAAIKTVAETLKWKADPDFALRAAAVANKAARRGNLHNGNNPLPAQMGQRVIVNLSQVFVNKLQEVVSDDAMPVLEQIENNAVKTDEIEITVGRIPQKLTDSLSARSVRALFADGKQTEAEQVSDAVGSLFGNVPLLVSNG